MQIFVILFTSTPKIVGPFQDLDQAAAFGHTWQEQNRDDPRWNTSEVEDGYFENNEIFVAPFNPLDADQ